MKNESLITIIIPALNEEVGIKKTLLGIPKKELTDQGYDLEIIVIDGPPLEPLEKEVTS
jgi:glycosyltransferase involved in cell wall biosynthesis